MRRFNWFVLADLAMIIGSVLLPSDVRAQGVKPAERLPNVVVILADDYGYGSVGCYGADGRLIRTPNIDRLAREG